MKIFYAITGLAQVAAAGFAVLTYRALRNELNQTRRLQEQMEEDHARLVRNVIHAEHALKKQERTDYSPRDALDMS